MAKKLTQQIVDRIAGKLTSFGYGSSYVEGCIDRLLVDHTPTGEADRFILKQLQDSGVLGATNGNDH